MRRIFWALALATSTATVMTVAFAQQKSPVAPADGSGKAPNSRLLFVVENPDAPTAPRTEPSQPGVLRYRRSRSSRQGTAAPARSVTGLKNYHRELFGVDAPAPGSTPSETTAQKSQTPVPGTAPRPLTPAAGADAVSGPATAPEPAIRRVSAEEPAPATGEAAHESHSGVQQAAFARPAGESEVVQPISGRAPATGPLAIPQTFQDPAHGGLSPASRSTSKTAREILTNLSAGQPKLDIEWRQAGDISIGQESTVELIVANHGDATAGNVIVEAWFPATVRLTKTEPQPDAVQKSVSWRFDRLDAGDERRISISLIPSQRGELAANANITFTTAATSQFHVEEPMIRLVMQGPDQVMIGEPAPHIVTVSNPGTGVARNVVIEVKVPDGLEHARGERLKMDVGSLNPGESRSVRLSLNATSGGTHAVQVEARAGQELRQVASSEVSVLAPELQLAVAGPSFRYVGRDAQYRIAVRNNGQATTSNVRATCLVPEGFEFLAAGRGGKFDPASRTVGWFVGSVQPNETIEMSLSLKPVTAGEFVPVARVISEHGAAVEAQTTTKIEGTASLVLEVADLDDPIEIGRETAYEIRVSNEGSRDASNVGLSIELPGGMTLVDAAGPSEHISESGLVVFRSLPALPPGKTATFLVHIKGSQAGNQRIRARLVSDSIQEPLTEEEITRFYAE